ncbi:hypothetical protein FQR65_LT09038 [Abscondita terminalis]|nr:hypothetical protein FQR65_LT09038 [Abscondita terminalis]
MATHFVSVCMFCFICATHFPCESHAGITHASTTNHKSDVPFAESDSPPAYLQNRNDSDIRMTSLKRRSTQRKHSIKNNRLRRSSNHSFDTGIVNSNKTTDSISNSYNINNSKEQEEYIKKIFAKYGDGNSLTMEGFEQLLNQLDLMAQVLHNKSNPTFSLKNLATLISHETENTTDSNYTCINRKKMIENVSTKDTLNNTLNNNIDNKVFERVCPALLYSVVVGTCNQDVEIARMHLIEPVIPADDIHYTVWLNSTIAVIIISACGMLGLGVVPLMQKRCYKSLLQFLVALAVGTLAGDALIHLLPHAMSTHNHEHNRTSHDEIMWKGFVAMLAIIFFFIVERAFVIGAKWRKERHLEDKIPKMKVMKEGIQPSTTSEKQCKHKYSSIPYCYDAIAMIDKNRGQDGINSHNDTTSTNLFDLDSDLQHSICNNLETNQNMTECPSELNASNCTEVNKMLENEKDDANSVEYTVILREHENRHHGHSHAHGHVHAAPKDLSSVAWMVILGDGIHNFADGMAIGAAFSGSIAGGFSTAVAVFCHELPHELGDFAMLLKAGMTIKQALFYNLLSSILCLMGNIFGVWLGTTESASSWVFAVAAGSFIYIALVDMLPELSSSHEEEGILHQCLLQLSGLLVGFAIMTFIALYEHDLKHIFHEP